MHRLLARTGILALLALMVSPQARAQRQTAFGEPAERVVRGSVDTSVKPAQAVAMPAVPMPQPPNAMSVPLSAEPPPGSQGMFNGQSISLQTALYGALTNNPALAGIRNNATAPTPESVEVARRFPTTMNPTLWIDYRPITLIPPEPFTTTTPGGSGGGSGGSGTATTPRNGSYYHWGQQYIYVSLRQPIELGHQTTHRYHMAQAAYDQYRWQVMQAEFQTMVQTYNLFQTAAYRREKYRLARQLAGFNRRLEVTLRRQVQANLVPAADLVLAEIESEATQQAVATARQDYLTALNALQVQMGVPEAAGLVEPLGEFALPETIPQIDEEEMIQTALDNRPSVRAAMAQLRGSHAAIELAKANRIPNPVIGPQYEMDEGGLQYVGFVYVTQVPFLNSGNPLVRQREAEARRAHDAVQQAERQVIAEVRSAVAKWNGASKLVRESAGLTARLAERVRALETLFEAGQTRLSGLMQARQRLLQLESSRLDATWQATQAQADLLLALGAPHMLAALVAQAEADAMPGPSGAAASAGGGVQSPGQPQAVPVGRGLEAPGS